MDGEVQRSKCHLLSPEAAALAALTGAPKVANEALCVEVMMEQLRSDPGPTTITATSVGNIANDKHDDECSTNDSAVAVVVDDVV